MSHCNSNNLGSSLSSTPINSSTSIGQISTALVVENSPSNVSEHSSSAAYGYVYPTIRVPGNNVTLSDAIPKGESPFMDSMPTPQRRHTALPSSCQMPRARANSMSLDAHSLYTPHTGNASQGIWCDAMAISPTRAARYPYWNGPPKYIVGWANATGSPAIQPLSAGSPTLSHNGLIRENSMLMPSPSYVAVPSSVRYYCDAPMQPYLEVPPERIMPTSMLGDYLVDSNSAAGPDLLLDETTSPAVLAGFAKALRNIDKFASSQPGSTTTTTACGTPAVPLSNAPAFAPVIGSGVPSRQPIKSASRSPHLAPVSTEDGKLAVCTSLSSKVPRPLEHIARPDEGDIAADAENIKQYLSIPPSPSNLAASADGAAAPSLSRRDSIEKNSSGGNNSSKAGFSQSHVSPLDYQYPTIFGAAPPSYSEWYGNCMGGAAAAMERSCGERSLGAASSIPGIGGGLVSPGLADSMLFLDPICLLSELEDLIEVASLFEADVANIRGKLTKGSTSMHAAASHALASLVKLQTALCRNFSEDMQALLQLSTFAKDIGLVERVGKTEEDIRQECIVRVANVANVLMELQDVVCYKKITADYMYEALSEIVNMLDTAMERSERFDATSSVPSVTVTTTSNNNATTTSGTSSISETFLQNICLASSTKISRWLVASDDLAEELGTQFPALLKECVTKAMEAATVQAALTLAADPSVSGNEVNDADAHLKSAPVSKDTSDFSKLLESCAQSLEARHEEIRKALSDEYDAPHSCYGFYALPSLDVIQLNFSNLKQPSCWEWWYKLVELVHYTRDTATQEAQLVNAVKTILMDDASGRALVMALKGSSVERTKAEVYLSKCAKKLEQCRGEHDRRARSSLRRIMRCCITTSVSTESMVQTAKAGTAAEMMSNCFYVHYYSVRRAAEELSEYAAMGAKDIHDLLKIVENSGSGYFAKGGKFSTVSPSSDIKIVKQDSSLESTLFQHQQQQQPGADRHMYVLSHGCSLSLCRFCKGEVRSYYANASHRLMLFEQTEKSVGDAIKGLCDLIKTIGKEVTAFPHMPEEVTMKDGEESTEMSNVPRKRSSGRAQKRLQDSMQSLVEDSTRITAALQKC